MLIAGLYRFWNIQNLDFSHDELSALFRTQFDSLSALIDQAIRVDGHPALTQLFLYYWAPLVGFSEFWVKLPFILAGLSSLVLIYDLAKTIYPENDTALFAPAIMAASELFLYHHQVARPYALGGLFVSWAAWAYVKWFYQKKDKKFLSFFILASAFAAYSHYLALLSVMIIGISALIRDREKPKAWLISAFVVFLLFSPHLGIFWQQLKLGGIGQWLSKPGADWFLHFFDYSWNFLLGSNWLRAILIAGFLFGALKSKFKEGWLWTIACFLIAFFYSVFRNPVLQYSSLVFLAPLLFVVPLKVKIIRAKFLALLILAILSMSLIFKRQYFQEALISPPKEATRYLANKPGLAVYYHWSEEKWDFYKKIDSNIVTGIYLEELRAEDLPKQEFILIMDHQSPGHWPFEVSKQGYRLVQSENHFGFRLLHFSPNSSQLETRKLGLRLMESTAIPEQDKQYLKLVSLNETLELMSQPQSSVVIEIESLKLNSPAHLIFQITDGDEQLGWFAHELNPSQKYYSRPIGNHPLEDYQWNVLIDQGHEIESIQGTFNVSLIEGNPKVYGLVEDFSD